MLDILENVERVPTTYLKYIEGTNGLFEVRVQLGTDIFRIFCCFDGNRLVVLFSGFQKETQKTPQREIARAISIMRLLQRQKRRIMKNIQTLDQLKDKYYGELGTPERDRLENELEALRIGFKIRSAREQLNMTQEQLAARIEKKRTYISKVENDGENITLRTLYDIVERGLGGKLRITFEF